MSKKKYMRNPNGFGSVYKLSGNRRRPWVACKTMDYNYNEEKKQFIAKRQIIGYYRERQEAMTALMEFNKSPYDIQSNTITFAEMYDRWSREYFEGISAASYQRTIYSAYHHSKPLHNMRMKNIKVAHLEQTILNANVGNPTKQRMKSLYNLMYRYAMKHEVVEKDYAQLCNPVKAVPPKEKVPFTREEIDRLWENLDIPYVDMILIEIYSGWRPQELCLLKTENVDLDNLVVYGGMKTAAGRDRAVPIHSRLMPLYRKRAKTATETQFFVDIRGNLMTYHKYRHAFNRVMRTLGMKHSPHETRHTFISMLDTAGANHVCIKLLVGHSLRDITEKVYTHKDLTDLRNAVELLV